MFSVHCASHGSPVLLMARNIESVSNDDHGICVRWRCDCGHRGSFRTGAARHEQAA